MAAITTAILAAAAIGGLGLQAYGTAQSSRAAKSQAQSQQNIADAQQRQEALRQKQMELDARRRQIESIRQAQRARSLALATANAQGAGQFGSSGLPGGFGQISGEQNTQLLGVNQALQLGRENFGLSSEISANRYAYAGASGDFATGQGLSSLGGALISSLGPIERLSGGFGSSSGPSSYGNYGGVTYPIYGRPY